MHLFDMVLGYGCQFFYVLEQGRVLGVAEYAVSEWAGVALHPSMHQVNEVKLETEQTVDSFLFTHLTGTNSLKIQEYIKIMILQKCL